MDCQTTTALHYKHHTKIVNTPVKLKTGELNLADDLKPTNPKEIIDGIAQEARTIWGEEWFMHIVRRYCELEGEITGTVPLARQRRSTIERVFETGNATLETTAWLAACVNSEIQLAVHRIEVRKFRQANFTQKAERNL